MPPSIAPFAPTSNLHRVALRVPGPGRWLAALLVGVLLASFGLAARSHDGARAP